MQRHILFYIHIPKCAGSSFVTILKRNFTSGFGDGRSFLSDVHFKYSEENIMEILENFPRLTCFSDHKLTIHLPYDKSFLNIQVIAFIREPIDRFLSHYFYCRNNPINNFDCLAKELDLEKYVDRIIADRTRQDLLDGQTYHLTGVDSHRDIPLIKELIKNRKLLLFNVSKFDESCVILEQLFPQKFQNCTYIKKNISHKDQKVTPELKRKISQYMNLDFQLLEMANLQMEEISNELFTSEADKKKLIEEFNNRCDKLNKYINNPWRLLKLSGLKIAQHLLDDPKHLKAFIN